MWRPSLACVAGAGMPTDVPAVHAPPSSLYWLSSTPEPASLAVSVRVSGRRDQPDAGMPDTLVTGATASSVPSHTSKPSRT
jgi:hypothetical protein